MEKVVSPRFLQDLLINEFSDVAFDEIEIFILRLENGLGQQNFKALIVLALLIIIFARMLIILEL